MSIWVRYSIGGPNIPRSIYKLWVMNQLTGDIPMELGALVKLLDLSLSYNKLNGSIQRSLGNLTRLVSLFMSINQPSTFWRHFYGVGELVRLKIFILYDNDLHGIISRSLGNLTNLVAIAIFNNVIGGTIPSEIGNLNSKCCRFLTWALTLSTGWFQCGLAIWQI